MSLEPLRLIEIVTEQVGVPSMDGSRGSGLYPVPVKLSRRPTTRESGLLVQHWDRPAEFTTMHRPGIARVSGDRIILNGTTLEEVAQYHKCTLELAVAATNRDEQALQERDAAGRRREEGRLAAHRQHVEDVAKQITFDT